LRFKKYDEDDEEEEEADALPIDSSSLLRLVLESTNSASRSVVP